jgi:predicted deacylase
VLAEAGGIGQLTMPDVDILVDGTRRALQVAGNLPGTPQAPETLHIARSTAVQAETDGFWICDVRAGDEVAAGQQLGRICDLLGETRVTVAAPHAGWVIYRTTSAAVKQGGLLMSVGVPA